jgi:hypothetical protein
MLGILKDLLALPKLNDLAVVQDGDVIADVVSRSQIMLDVQKAGLVFLLERQEQVDDDHPT